MITLEEKDFLWKKLEYKKKKIAEDTKNDLYEILKTDKKVTSEDFIKVYNSLEYSFKKKLTTDENGKELFLSIKSKIPKEIK